MLKRRTHNRNQAGDTIVEVLIAIAVISLVLVGAFLVSNHSTQAVQASAEHDKAQQYLQSEIENLRVYLTTTSAVPNTDFCFAPSMSGVAMYVADQPVSNSCSISDGATYKQVIKPISSQPNTYDCIIQWDALIGGTSEVEFIYRDYATGTTAP